MFEHLNEEEERAVLKLAVFSEALPREFLGEILGPEHESLVAALYDKGMISILGRRRIKVFDSIAEHVQRTRNDLQKLHLAAGSYYVRRMQEEHNLLSVEYPGYVKSMYHHYRNAGRSVDGANELKEQLLRWIHDLNEIRNYTYSERVERAAAEGSDRMRRTLDICFRVVETFEPRKVVLDQLLGLIEAPGESNLVRAQPMYFVLMARLHMNEMSWRHWERLLDLVHGERNAHIVFHILQALAVCVRLGRGGFGPDNAHPELVNQARGALFSFVDGSAPCRDDIVRTYCAYVETEMDDSIDSSELGRKLEGLMESVPAVLAEVDELARLEPDERLVENEVTERTWERIELLLFTIGDVALAGRVPDKSALDVMRKALRSKFWIVRWWAITNLAKIRTDLSVDMLIDVIEGTLDGRVALLDLGMLGLRSLGRMRRFAIEAENDVLATRIEQRLGDLLADFCAQSSESGALVAAIEKELMVWRQKE
ncbi:MAG: HEAT repeat domain-containing protein [Planctomycetota bacterium]